MRTGRRRGYESSNVQRARVDASEEAEMLGLQLAEQALARKLAQSVEEILADMFRIFMNLAHRLGVEMADHLAREGRTSLLGMLALDHIHRTGAPGGARDLQIALGTAPASVSALLRRLERDGLLTLPPHGRDGRRKMLRLTHEGRLAAQEAARFFGSWQSDYVNAAFEDEDVRRMYHYLLAFQELVAIRQQGLVGALDPRRPRAERRPAVHLR